MSGAGPSLYPGEFPKWAVFKFPPDAAPPAVPPPLADAPFTSFRNPFPIPAHIYNAVLEPAVPLTVAAVYATTISLLNAYNRKHGNKPWQISKTRAFHAFVIFHNVFLAVYSAVTCWAMIRSLKHAIPHYSEPNALVGTVDALCKIHGPRGLGDAVYYNPEAQHWESKNPNIQLDPYGLPQSDDLGRIWNEGLGFWGWIFYLSKFYEVVDTIIIILKGKRSSTLQTYHHAGAMLSMWSGIRYMSPPIWMFALVNSGIHAMMYTYYTITALGYRVPQGIKRTLTTMQITQFIVGVTYAAAHLFVSYTVPVTVAYQIAEKVVPKVNASSIVAAASSVTSTAVPAATGAGLAFLKKWIYRAAGDEGLAENVFAASAVPAPHPHVAANNHATQTQTRTVYRTQYEHVPCIDTSGQAFAIYLNLIYLAPLTALFTRFFVKSYLRGNKTNSKKRSTPEAIAKSTRDAIKETDREVESLGKSAEENIDQLVNGRGRPTSSSGRPTSSNGSAKTEKSAQPNGQQSNAEKRNGNGDLSPDNKRFVDSLKSKVSQELERIGEGDSGSRERARKAAKEAVSEAERLERSVSREQRDGEKVGAKDGDQSKILGRPNAGEPGELE